MIAAADTPLVDALHPSPNVEPRRGGMRPSILLLHYTGLPTVERALEVLSREDCKVSCHYVIDLDGRITQMVAEHLRAWHAGVSSWADESDINSASVGIEIHNVGHNAGYPEFPAAQMRAVLGLAADIVRRHGIRPERVLAHSDVAPGRKIDPGEKFDWALLAGRGIGLWVEPVQLDAADAFWAGLDVALVAVPAKLLLSGRAVARSGQELNFAARTRLVAPRLLPKGEFFRKLGAYGAAAATLYVVARHPSLLNSVFAELAELAGISPWVVQLAGWSIVIAIILMAFSWLLVPITTLAIFLLKQLQRLARPA